MKRIIGISMGEPAGIGAEVVVKALMDKKIYDCCIPLVIGDRCAMEDAMRALARPDAAECIARAIAAE